MTQGEQYLDLYLWLTKGNSCLLQVAFIGVLLFGAVNNRGFLTFIRAKGAELRPLPVAMVGDDLCYADTSTIFIPALIQRDFAVRP